MRRTTTSETMTVVMARYIDLSIYRFDTDISYRIVEWILKFSIYRDTDFSDLVVSVRRDSLSVYLLMYNNNDVSVTDRRK